MMRPGYLFCCVCLGNFLVFAFLLLELDCFRTLFPEAVSERAGNKCPTLSDPKDCISPG